MPSDFDKRSSELIHSKKWGSNVLGIGADAEYFTRHGVSSQVSFPLFVGDVPENELQVIPDFILSDSLEKDLSSAVFVCACELRKTKYLPDTAEAVLVGGAVPDGRREGANLEKWKDLGIVNYEGCPLYTQEDLDVVTDGNELRLALWLIVKDICDDGGFLSEDWYYARILLEYFFAYPVEENRAYLIGALFKELCIKQVFEKDLSTYYKSEEEAQIARVKGASINKDKAEELRQYCVGLFVELYRTNGPRLLLAPDAIKADELMRLALSRRPTDFQRGGKPYRKEWFLNNVIEDRRLEIAQAIEALER